MKLKEEIELRVWASCEDGQPFCIHPALDPKSFYKGITALIRAVDKSSRKDEREKVWTELEPFIGIDPRHDGDPPEYDKKCPKCEEVRRIKNKYSAALREGKR